MVDYLYIPREGLLRFRSMAPEIRIGNTRTANARMRTGKIKCAVCDIPQRSFPTYCPQHPRLGHSHYAHLADKQDLTLTMTSGDADQTAAHGANSHLLGYLLLWRDPSGLS